MSSEVSCNLCSGKADLLVDHPDFTGVGVHYCQKCDYWFASPEPSSEALNRYYKDIYSPSREAYLGDAYYLLMKKRAAAQVRFIENAMRSAGCELQGIDALDLGCGYGALVAELNSSGVCAVGYDSDERIIQLGREHGNSSVFPGYVDSAVIDDRFTLVTLSHVLEHLKDVKSALHGMLELVDDQGFLYVEVPNCFPEMFTHGVDAESHLHFFTSSSLSALLSDMGLDVIDCRVCGPKTMESYGLKLTIWSKLRRKLQRYMDRLCSYGAKGGSLKTIYDGYYDHYPQDGDGIWLRAVARKKAS